MGRLGARGDPPQPGQTVGGGEEEGRRRRRRGAGASQEGGRGGERLFTQEGCADSTFLEFTLLSLSLL